MSYDNYNTSHASVRVHRLPGGRLEELARIQLKHPSLLLWLAYRLLVAKYYIENRSQAARELEVSDMRLERRRELIATSDEFAVVDELLRSLWTTLIYTTN